MLSDAGERVALQREERIIIERALRDEGTSHHYLEPSLYAKADPMLVSLARAAVSALGMRVKTSPAWTTDALFRETALTIAMR